MKINEAQAREALRRLLEEKRTVAQLAKDHGVGKTTMREALRIANGGPIPRVLPKRVWPKYRWNDTELMKMVELRLRGLYHREIGAHFGISEENARLILVRARKRGLFDGSAPVAEARGRLENRRRVSLAATIGRDQVVQAYEEHLTGDLTIVAAAKRFGCAKSTVTRWFTRIGGSLPKREPVALRNHVEQREKVERSDLILGLFSVYLENGIVLPIQKLADACAQRLRRTVAPSTVRRTLRAAGYEQVRAVRAPSVLDRVGEERIVQVGTEYARGMITLVEATEMLGCGKSAALRWFDTYGMRRRGAA